MAFLMREDDVRLHWTERGQGPLVVMVPHWSSFPSVFEPLANELAGDHRVLTYDARGTGRSSRQGPYDLETGAADLAALLEMAGEPAAIVAMNDACTVAISVATSNPDLVRTIVAPATLPVPRGALADTDALISSDGVVDGFMELLINDYRGAQRAVMSSANAQMSEEDVRERVDQQVAYCPPEVAITRAKDWAEGDPLDAARQCGERLQILASDAMVGPWFPPPNQVEELVHRLLPEARFEEVADGLVSRPDLTAEIIRQSTLRPYRGEML